MTSALLLAVALASPAVAQTAPDPQADVTVLPGWRTAEGLHMAALRISLDAGWKTYWRAPGEAGIPPHVDWSGSANLDGVGFHWPVPEIIVSNGVTTLGYDGDVILPFEVTATDPGADITLEATLAFGICEDVCMPLQTKVSAVLPAGARDEDPRIADALADRPATSDDAGVKSSACGVEPIADGLRVTARIEMPAVGPDEFLIIEPADPSIWVSQAMVRREGQILIAQADLVPPDAKPFDLETETLRITVLAAGRGVDIHGCDGSR